MNFIRTDDELLLQAHAIAQGKSMMLPTQAHLDAVFRWADRQMAALAERIPRHCACCGEAPADCPHEHSGAWARGAESEPICCRCYVESGGKCEFAPVKCAGCKYEWSAQEWADKVGRRCCNAEWCEECFVDHWHYEHQVKGR